MVRTTWLATLALILVLLFLNHSLLTPVFAQMADNTPATDETIDGSATEETVGVIETDEFPFREFSRIDAGAYSLFLPLISGGNADEVNAAAALRRTVLEVWRDPRR